ncbi:ribonuclease T [secondary endosymbiont of Heteropsylla cubana]|uniref:Ribonuclease T n=1 Tax=secondary endosymbiont of Heteropsylla cubana TaxID=134287 RepID=J3VTU3_9ENTR|nr:ribonuclease T [secondary endosymbiont of Heteropsylla cubana]AFP85436.1 ribonuclease T [secondary endosymbiont of Heteropsylla cubana]
MGEQDDLTTLSTRFRGFYPVVVDVETAGFNSSTDALLEIAAMTLKMDKNGWLQVDSSLHFHIIPFPGGKIQPESLAFNGIQPDNPLRGAIEESKALDKIFKTVRKGMRDNNCKRAIIVAHNAAFDHAFLMAAASRSGFKKTPFHPFATFDTVSLSGLVLGHTVLAKACVIAGLTFDNEQAHSALYDTERTATLFCSLVNRWKSLGGWPLEVLASTNNKKEDTINL